MLARFHSSWFGGNRPRPALAINANSSANTQTTTTQRAEKRQTNNNMEACTDPGIKKRFYRHRQTTASFIETLFRKRCASPALSRSGLISEVKQRAALTPPSHGACLCRLSREGFNMLTPTRTGFASKRACTHAAELYPLFDIQCFFTRSWSFLAGRLLRYWLAVSMFNHC